MLVLLLLLFLAQGHPNTTSVRLALCSLMFQPTATPTNSSHSPESTRKQWMRHCGSSTRSSRSTYPCLHKYQTYTRQTHIKSEATLTHTHTHAHPGSFVRLTTSQTVSALPVGLGPRRWGPGARCPQNRNQRPRVGRQWLHSGTSPLGLTLRSLARGSPDRRCGTIVLIGLRTPLALLLPVPVWLCWLRRAREARRRLVDGLRDRFWRCLRLIWSWRAASGSASSSASVNTSPKAL